MDKISFLIDDKDKGYSLSVNEKSPMFYFNKEDLWLCIYSMVKDIDFSTTNVSIAGINAPSIEVLVVIFKSFT
jgi:hypothetical protein